MKIFRLSAAKFKDTMFTGEGTRLYGGRWNTKGHAVAYCAESLALATLEQLVHFDAFNTKTNLVYSHARIPENISKIRYTPADLPPNWNAPEGPLTLQAKGDDWLDSTETAVLIVPSVIVPTEHNILLNPRHTDFKTIKWAKPQPFTLDPRLLPPQG